MGNVCRNVWDPQVDRVRYSVCICDTASDFVWQRGPPLESHVKDWPFCDIHERLGSDPDATTTLNAPQTAAQQQLAKRFAYRKIEALEDNLLFSHEPQHIEQQITDIALQYGIVSDYTSLIAVEEKISRDPSVHGLAATEVPSAMPAGNTMAFPQGSLGLAWRWALSLVFTLLAILFGLATLCQVRSHSQSSDYPQNRAGA